MKLITVQWNIGGGKIRRPDDDRAGRDVYRHDGIDHIVAVLQEVDADIVTLQEVHGNDDVNQVVVLAERLGFAHDVDDFYETSHINEEYKLGHGMLSKYPLTEHVFEHFHNPQLELEWNGRKCLSPDKGMTKCTAMINEQQLNLATLHLIPFRPFNVDPLGEEVEAVRADIQKKVAKATDSSPWLLQGDFNYNNADQCLDMGFRAADAIKSHSEQHGSWQDLRAEHFERYKIVD